MRKNKLNNDKRCDDAVVIITRLKEMGFTQKAIADASDLHETHICRIMRGPFSGITKGTLLAIEEAERILMREYTRRKKILQKKPYST